MTQVTRVLAVVSIILLCLLSQVSGEQEKQKEGIEEHSDVVNKAIHWAQVVNSLVESFVERGDLQGWMDKLKALTYQNIRPEDSERKKTRTYTLYQRSNLRDTLEVSDLKLNVPDKSLKELNNPKAKTTNPVKSCSQGVVAVPISTVFTCNGVEVPGSTYATKDFKQRTSCTYPEGTAEVCICPPSAAWTIKGIKGTWVCTPRLLMVSPRLSDEFICRDEIKDNSLGFDQRSESDFCLRVHRHATLKLSVNISYRWADNDEMLNFVAVHDRTVVFGKVPEDQVYTVLNKGVPGTYKELGISEALFAFPVKTESHNPYAFRLHSGHPLMKDGYFERIVYPFSHPELIESGSEIKDLSNVSILREFFESTANYTIHTVQLDLNSISDEFVAGNTMYMEIGFSSSGVPFKHRCARVWITFDDIPTPLEHYEYNQPVNPLLIAVAVIVSALFLAIIVAFLRYFCHQRQVIDDQLVTKALRERESKKQR
ncbi:hypothetical protein LSM04_006228 [Trypanosoma melophagium]|uniref:uncharacterized protein n=1 Tax=Trypanosoma melophagium TaxID=715481 RepID=UPI00351A0BA8|nr:hypothetical protein LSM04_006228 [Trypanosoma melophagium]